VADTRTIDERPLNENQLRFVDALFEVEFFNATEAYMLAYPSSTRRSAGPSASVLLDDPRIAAAVTAKQAERRERAGLTAVEVVQHIRQLAEADPRELTEYRVGACRYCHGYDHKYQRRPSEFDAALRLHIADREALRRPDPLGLDFDAQGGVGYRRDREPHPDCPECEGRGEGYEIIKDTRKLSPAAARLYSGIKRTKEGIEVKTRNQDKALEMAGKNTGVIKDNHELTGRNGSPLIPGAPVDVTLPADPIEAAAAYDKLMRGG
jgi:phage terminase small subunit